MDAFYASVEERERPELRGKPLVVGGRADARGVVAAANYAARKFGIHSAMPTAAAVRRYPQVVIVPPRGKMYAAVSAQIHQIFNRYTPLIEPLSLDEAFLDPSGSERLHGDAEQIGVAIKRDIYAELQLVASVGVAPNKFLAKLASGHNKPNGFTVLHQQHAQAFLDRLPIERISGVGRVAKARLHRVGIRTVLQLRQASQADLRAEFGHAGERLWQLAHGVDERAVIPYSEAKSISQETTFAADIADLDILQATALALTEEVGYRLRCSDLRGGTVQLKIRFGDFSTITRARGLRAASNVTADLWEMLSALLQQQLGARKFAVRLLGVGVTNLQRGARCGNAGQADLLRPHDNRKQQALDALSDQVRTRYGSAKIRRGSSLLA